MCIVFFQAFDPPTTSAPDDDLSSSPTAEREIARRYAFVLASNRDEYLTRPTRRAHVWEPEDASPTAVESDAVERHEEAGDVILAGRDLTGGGTWLGVTRSGRVSVLTNYRTPGDDAVKGSKRSRGQLVLGYLRNNGGKKPVAYAERVVTVASEYAGFNLMVGDLKSILKPPAPTPSLPASLAPLVYVSNKADPPLQALASDRLYAMANRLLDTPWAKLTRGKGLFRACRTEAAAVLCREETDGGDAIDVDTAVAHIFLRRLLADGHVCAPATDTGYGVDVEGKLASICIPGVSLREGAPLFGTSTQMVLLVRWDGRMLLYERALLPGPGPPRGDEEAGAGGSEMSGWHWSEVERFEMQIDE